MSGFSLTFSKRSHIWDRQPSIKPQDCWLHHPISPIIYDISTYILILLSWNLTSHFGRFHLTSTRSFLEMSLLLFLFQKTVPSAHPGPLVAPGWCCLHLHCRGELHLAVLEAVELPPRQWEGRLGAAGLMGPKEGSHNQPQPADIWGRSCMTPGGFHKWGYLKLVGL